MRILTFTSLFPSTARPRHGIFVETRLRQLVSDTGIDARVIAPVPWFPFRSPRFGDYARFAATPRHALRDSGLRVSHPRYLMLPKVGVGLQPESMARAAMADVAALADEGWRPDLIDAHYLYPDGVAAAMLAQRLGLPFVVTARGTDVNVLGRMPGPAQRILDTVRRAAAVIAVSSRLKESLLSLGADADKVVVLRNGVDAELFRPEPGEAARARLCLPNGPLAACVGNLVPEKGLALAIEALRSLPEWRLAIVGDGPLRSELAALVAAAGLASRVSFLPVMPQAELRWVYSAADALLLTSTREGWPNVVLESLACGTPVVAVDVGAVGEMITVPEAGRVVAGRDATALAAAVRAVQALGATRAQVRQHALQFDWVSVSRGQWELFTLVLAHERPARADQPEVTLSAG